MLRTPWVGFDGKVICRVCQSALAWLIVAVRVIVIGFPHPAELGADFETEIEGGTTAITPVWLTNQSWNKAEISPPGVSVRIVAAKARNKTTRFLWMINREKGQSRLFKICKLGLEVCYPEISSPPSQGDR